MLKSLFIKDYALIEEISIAFEAGLNIITGETGAGKSILLDALGLLLGERSSAEVVRKDAAKAIVEGIFDISNNNKIRRILSGNEIESGDELIVRREISAKGTSRCFLNDTPVALSVLKEAGDYLVDLHGQHEHQSLLRKETHLEMLDEFAQNEHQLEDYRNEYKKLQSVKKELQQLYEKAEKFRERKDIYYHQMKEIETVNPQKGEDEELSAELKILENSEQILEHCESAYNILYDEERSAYDLLGQAKTNLQELAKIDPSFNEALEEIESALVAVSDVTAILRDYKNKIDLEPAKLDFMRSRISAINSLKKKYGGSIESVLAVYEKAREESLLADNFEESVSGLKKELEQLKKSAGIAAQKLSETRKKASEKISKQIVSALKELGIMHARFSTVFTPVESEDGEGLESDGNYYKYNENGFDVVEFFLSANAGEDPKPLAKVASGGEVSRIMLAMKTILAKSDKLPLLVFDEIDTGVSGRIAQKVGQALKNLAAYHQIISITHLPQIAGLADRHFVAEKAIENGRTFSRFRILNDEERVKEVAKLLSGEVITESALNSARELMGR